MKRKVYLIVFIVALIAGTVSAWEWDNSLDYKDGDMTITLTNNKNEETKVVEPEVSEEEKKEKKKIHEDGWDFEAYEVKLLNIAVRNKDFFFNIYENIKGSYFINELVGKLFILFKNIYEKSNIFDKAVVI